jgi:hypothetical protein
VERPPIEREETAGRLPEEERVEEAGACLEAPAFPKLERDG